MNLTTLTTTLSPYIHLPPRIHTLISSLPLPASLNLSLAPLLALADFTLISLRTIQSGTSSLLDILILCPGLHKQSSADQAHHGEYPATAAMTTGYVFRTENQACVHFFQRVGKTGSLVTLNVTRPEVGRFQGVRDMLFGPRGIESVHVALGALTVDVIAGLWLIGDFYALGFICMLILSRLLNMLAIRRRLAPEWKGALEPGVKGDLLVLLSQDRWVRVQGLVDDLKAVTSGQWLRDKGFVEECLVDLGTVLVYAGVVVGSNSTQKGGLMVAALLVVSSMVLGVANRSGGKELWMHGRVVSVGGEKKYARRRELADELIAEHGRDDWAIGMGMIPPKDKSAGLAIM